MVNILLFFFVNIFQNPSVCPGFVSTLANNSQPLFQVQLEGSESGHTVRVSLPGDLVGQVGQQQSDGLAVVQAGCYPQGPILMPGPIVGGVQQFLTLHQPRYQTQ